MISSNQTFVWRATLFDLSGTVSRRRIVQISMRLLVGRLMAAVPRSSEPTNSPVTGGPECGGNEF